MDFDFEQTKAWPKQNIVTLPYVEPVTGLPFTQFTNEALKELQSIKQRLDILERKLNEQT